MKKKVFKGGLTYIRKYVCIRFRKLVSICFHPINLQCAAKSLTEKLRDSDFSHSFSGWDKILNMYLSRLKPKPP